MSVIRTLRNSLLGRFVERLKKAPLLGHVVGAAVLRARAVEQWLIRRSPQHQAHDQRQRAILEQFAESHVLVRVERRR